MRRVLFLLLLLLPAAAFAEEKPKPRPPQKPCVWPPAGSTHIPGNCIPWTL